MTDLPPSSSIPEKTGSPDSWEVQPPQPAQAPEIQPPPPEQPTSQVQPLPVEQPQPEIQPEKPPQPPAVSALESVARAQPTALPEAQEPTNPLTTEDLGQNVQEAEEEGTQKSDPYAHLEENIG